MKKYYKKEYTSLHIYTIYPVIKITFCPNSYSLQTVCKVKYDFNLHLYIRITKIFRDLPTCTLFCRVILSHHFDKERDLCVHPGMCTSCPLCLNVSHDIIGVPLLVLQVLRDHYPCIDWGLVLDVLGGGGGLLF